MPRTSRTGTVPDHETTPTDTGPLSLDEIITRYRGEWILMRITGHDEGHWPAEGYVVAHAESPEELLEAQAQAPRATPGQPYTAFLAVPDITSGPVHEAAIKRFIGSLIVATRADRDRAGA